MRSKWVLLLVPFATFVAGAVLQLVFQRYTDDNLTDTDQVVFALVMRR